MRVLRAEENNLQFRAANPCNPAAYFKSCQLDLRARHLCRRLWSPTIMPLIRLKPLILVLSIFTMAEVYDLLWSVRPDWFRVQSDVNFLPLDLARAAQEYSAYSRAKPLPEFISDKETATAAQRIEEIYQQFYLASTNLAHLRAEYENSERQDAQESKLFEASQFAQLEDYVITQTAPFVSKIQDIQHQMDELSPTDNTTMERDHRVGPFYAALNVQRAQLEVQRAEAEVVARDYALHHLRGFQNQPLQVEYLKHRDALDITRQSLEQQQTLVDSLHEKLYDALISYRSSAGNRLRYADFLYFSVGAATTATFGDIAPNSTSIRMLVCLQVLISVVITGLMVNDLATAQSSRFRSP
jgi:hypothetical protein